MFDTPLHEEVMSALAISARTEAYYHVSRGRDAFWHVAAKDVGYNGYGVTKRENGVEEAVDRTREFVLNIDNDFAVDNYFVARWTENSSGKTAPLHVMFRSNMGAPQVGVEVPFAKVNRENSLWTFETSKAELATLVSQMYMSACNQYTQKRIFNSNTISQKSTISTGHAFL